MICYRDMTFCGYHLICKKGHDCPRALTMTVSDLAKKKGLGISQFAEFPDCYEELWKDAGWWGKMRGTTGKPAP